MRLSDVVGHKRLIALISRAIDRDTLPPTLLFAGPSGVGKWAVAQAAAQAVNCLEPVRNLREEPPSGTTARTFVEDTDLTALRDSALELLQQTSGRADTQARLQAATNLVGQKSKERDREELAVVLRLTASMLRDIEAINAGADRRVMANPQLTGDLSTLARAFSGDRARSAFGAVDRALTALERNAGTKVVAEWLAVQI